MEASGIVLSEGIRYRITLDTPGDWFDKTVRADVDGFAATRWIHIVGTLHKRWWRQNWFKPIARVGKTGNDEYALDPVAPFEKHTYTLEAPEPPGGIPAKIDDATAQSYASLDSTPLERRRLVSEFTARTSGELFLYVNDAVWMWPGLVDQSYRNNRGSGTLTVERIMPDGERLPVKRSDAGG